MKMLHTTLLLAGCALSLPRLAAGQAESADPVTEVTLPSDGDSITARSCSYCNRVVLPIGMYVREVLDGGSYVTLEDGSTWEIRLPSRPVASSWRPGDFVQLKTIWAPVERYEVLLAHGDRDQAEARLAGRGRPQSAWAQQ